MGFAEDFGHCSSKVVIVLRSRFFLRMMCDSSKLFLKQIFLVAFSSIFKDLLSLKKIENCPGIQEYHNNTNRFDAKVFPRGMSQNRHCSSNAVIVLRSRFFREMMA